MSHMSCNISIFNTKQEIHEKLQPCYNKGKDLSYITIEKPAIYTDDQCLNNYLLAILNGKKTSQSLMKSF